MAQGPKFTLDFPENLKRLSNLPTTELLSFDDLSDFIEEREKIKREVDRRRTTQVRVDFSDFSNHVFFDSAESKFLIARDRTLNKYPYNGRDNRPQSVGPQLLSYFGSDLCSGIYNHAAFRIFR